MKSFMYTKIYYDITNGKKIDFNIMFHYIKVWYKNFEKNVIIFRSSTPHSETTESGECSEGEMSDLTPCNPSPSLSQLLSWSGCQGRANIIICTYYFVFYIVLQIYKKNIYSTMISKY